MCLCLCVCICVPAGCASMCPCVQPCMRVHTCGVGVCVRAWVLQVVRLAERPDPAGPRPCPSAPCPNLPSTARCAAAFGGLESPHLWVLGRRAGRALTGRVYWVRMTENRPCLQFRLRRNPPGASGGCGRCRAPGQLPEHARRLLPRSLRPAPASSGRQRPLVPPPVCAGPGGLR